MNKLEGVKRILESIGEPTAGIALDTGGTSIVSEAEVYLDRASTDVQVTGWIHNTIEDKEVTLAEVSIAVDPGATGKFTFGETVEGGTSGATGTVYYEINDTLYMKNVEGTFQDNETLTGASSGATRTAAGDPVTLTESRLIWEPGWLMVESWGSESIEVRRRDDWLYDINENTFIFERAIRVRLIYEEDFADLPESLARYIVALARYNFQIYKKNDPFSGQLLREELFTAKARALREDSRVNRFNLLHTPESIRVLGNRWTRPFP